MINAPAAPRQAAHHAAIAYPGDEVAEVPASHDRWPNLPDDTVLWAALAPVPAAGHLPLLDDDQRGFPWNA